MTYIDPQRFKEMAESSRKLFSKKSKKSAPEEDLKALSAEQGISVISSDTSASVSSGWATVSESAWASVEPVKPAPALNGSEPTPSSSTVPKLTFTSTEKTPGAKVTPDCPI